MASNSLYYGDNLDILRRYIRDETVDLVYLDPPFKSDQNYNVLFQEKDGSQSASQIKAFVDTWQWDEAAARSYEETVEAGGQVAQALNQLCSIRPLLGSARPGQGMVRLARVLSVSSPRSTSFRNISVQNRHLESRGVTGGSGCRPEPVACRSSPLFGR